MAGQLIRRIRTRLAWQVGFAAALLLVAFGVATAIVAQNRDESSSGGLVATEGRAGLPSDTVSSEQSKGTNSVAPAPAV